MDKRNIPCWSDLPQGIFEIIVNKLHFVDQIRAFAVCKTWRDCKDYVRCSDTLPWVISIQSVLDGENSFIFKLIDPYSRRVLNASKLINIIDPIMFSHPLAIKNGWMLFGGDESKRLMYNPFTSGYIHSVFPQIECEDIKATINVDPKSPNWELFIDAIPIDSGYLRIDTYTRSGLTSRSHVEISIYEQLHSMLYVKGNIYCLSETADLRRYHVEDGAWDLLTSEFPEPYKLFVERSWLMEINNNIVMVRMDFDDDRNYEWIIFRFDWSTMSWIVENSLKSCAIYITGDIAFSKPLTNQFGEDLEGCRLFYNNRYRDIAGGLGFKCYSLFDAEGTRMISSEEYGWITVDYTCHFSFIEPPYFWS